MIREPGKKIAAVGSAGNDPGIGPGPLVLLLVQLAALVFIFGHVVDLSIPNYRYRAISEAKSSAESNAA
jgi:hypothetical protein